MKKKIKMICPTCGKKNIWSSDHPFRPFCSERCKLIDLGQWATEKYKVAGEKADTKNTSEKDE